MCDTDNENSADNNYIQLAKNTHKINSNFVGYV